MIQLYTALIHVNVPEESAKNVLTELESTIHNRIEKEILDMKVSTIHPLIREQDGLRNDIHQLSEKLDVQVDRLNTKIDTMGEILNAKIDAVEERLNVKIDAVEERLNVKIDAVEERLNAKIDAVDSKLTVKFQFHDKLLWVIISLLLGLYGFVVTNSFLIYQKLK